MRKIISFIIILIFSVSQTAFCDELLNTPFTKASNPIESRKLSSNFNFSKSGNDLIGFGSDKIFQVHPGFEFSTTYDSNINREPPGQRNDDIIFRYVPSIDLVHRGTQLQVTTGYEMSFDEYLKDADQSGFNHVAKSLLNYSRRRLKATVDESFTWAKTYASNEQSERRTIVANNVSPEIAYRITPKFSLASLYRNYIFQYKESALRENSYDLNEIGGRIYYHATPKLDFYLHGSGNTVDYFNSGLFNSVGYSILVGSKGKMTKKLGIDLLTGYKGQRYDNSSINAFDGWTVQGSLQYRLSPKINVGVTGKRDREESVYRNVGYYRSNAVAVDLSYNMTSRITITLDGAIEKNAYPRETTEGTRTKKRNDTLSTAGAKINWRPARHLILSIGYGFRERASNFDNLFEYVDHALDTSVSYKF